MTSRRPINRKTQNSPQPDDPNTQYTTKQKATKLERSITILWHEIYPWQQDNHYIHSGYRPASNSYLKSVQSLLFLHNESVNIYTHLLGALTTLSLSAYFYHSLLERYETATADDVIVFACFFGGAACCLGMSATFHTISNHSHKVASWGNKLDYLGIVALIWGSFVPTLFYGFQDEIKLIRIYWTMITTIGLGCATVATANTFRTPKYRPVRAAMFVAMGLSALFPVIHGLRLYGYTQMSEMAGLDWVVLQGVLYILGAALYAARIPERFKPGRFDIWGSSHQIFHVLVLLAAAVHLKGLIKAFDYKHGRFVVPQHESLFKFQSWKQR